MNDRISEKMNQLHILPAIILYSKLKYFSCCIVPITDILFSESLDEISCTPVKTLSQED